MSLLELTNGRKKIIKMREWLFTACWSSADSNVSSNVNLIYETNSYLAPFRMNWFEENGRWHISFEVLLSSNIYCTRKDFLPKQLFFRTLDLIFLESLLCNFPLLRVVVVSELCFLCFLIVGNNFWSYYWHSSKNAQTPRTRPWYFSSWLC